MDAKIDMQYDGDSDNNPFVPSLGDWVLICEHPVRTKHVTLYKDPIELEGHSFHRLNLCAICAALPLDELRKRFGWRVYVWTAEDVQRVRDAAKGR